MSISFDPMMYFFGGFIIFASLMSILAVLLSLRLNSKRIADAEKQAGKKYISKREIILITNKIEDHVERIENKIEQLLTGIK